MPISGHFESSVDSAGSYFPPAALPRTWWKYHISESFPLLQPMYGVAPNASCRHSSMAARAYVFAVLGVIPQDFKNYAGKVSGDVEIAGGAGKRTAWVSSALCSATVCSKYSTASVPSSYFSP